MTNYQYLGAIIAFVTNIIILITQIVQVTKLKKEIKDVKIVVNNTSELKKALNKPLEGIWEVSGKYDRYHDDDTVHNCSGYANFIWDDINKKYNIKYSYSVRKEQSVSDLVTAICSGDCRCNSNGEIDHNSRLKLKMTINSRSATDNIESISNSFEFISEKITSQGDGITEIKFPFKTRTSDGIFILEDKVYV